MLYKKLKYDYECGIELFTVCNYSCDFCSGPRVRKLTRRGRTNEDIKKVIDFFNGTDKTWLLGMSGGEPTIHPFFGDLVNGLKEKHYFFFFTNLTFDVEKFVNLLPADRVQYMKTSLHPQADVDTFLDKYETLFGFGYNPILIMVSTPDSFDRISKVAEFCRDRQFPFTLSVLEGPYQSKNYPNDFTEKETRFVESHTEEPGNLIRLFSKSPGGLNTYGHSCPAGKKNFFLDMESGDLKTCESVYKVCGNVFEGTFSPQEENTVCPAINGCVGYDRSMNLPHAYTKFFHEGWNHWHLKDIKNDPSYPDNLFNIIRPSSQSEGQVEMALQAIQNCIGDSKTMFWGAGIYGSKILYYLKQKYPDNFKQIIGFVDSLKDRQKVDVLGLPVYAPKDPVVKEVDKILITSHAYEDEIVQVASNLGIETKVIALHKELLRPLGIEAAIF